MGSIIAKLGGRKFVGWIASTLGLIIAGISGKQISPELLETVTTIFGIFVGGNALEHGAEALSVRRSRLHIAADAAKADTPGGEVADDS